MTETTAAAEDRAIRVVPHFMRLHEWIALSEGYFRAEHLDAELMADQMHQVSGHAGDAYLHRPQDRVFVEEVANSACAWGSVCNAGAGVGRFVPDLYGVARFALFAAPDSGITRLSDLDGVPVGVGAMAGSHFTTLATLEQVLPRDRVRVADIGGPGRRLTALLDGTVRAATLLDPEIALAETCGLRPLALGEFRTLFWVSATVSPDVLARYFRALRRADEALRAQPERFLHLWERNVPPDLRDDHDYATFGRGELLVFEPFDDDMLAETVRFADRWGLRSHVTEQDLTRTAVRVPI